MNNMKTSSNTTKSLVKIIKADSLGNYAWNDNGTNDWSNATLNTLLNTGDLYTANIQAYDNLFESVVWNLGGSPGYSGVYAKDFYAYERGSLTGNSNAYAATWTGKIGLMYPSDYGYATSGGDTGRDACLNIDLYKWDGAINCYKENYLYDSSDVQWTLTPNSSNSGIVFIVHFVGRVYNYEVINGYAVRPVGYLKSDATISSGSGTGTDPWIVTIS
jgi:hypothetical protein